MGVNSREVDTELDVLGVGYSKNYINFISFIHVLELYTGESIAEIAERLIRSSDFLALDFYEYNFEIHCYKGTDYIFQSNSDMMSNSKIDHKLSCYKYDAFKNNEPASYPIEEFLIFISKDNFLTELSNMKVGSLPDFMSYYWKVEDILDTDYITRLGLNIDLIEVCKSILINGNCIALDYYNENVRLREKIIALQCDTANTQRPSHSTIDTEYQTVTKQLADAQAKIAELEQAISIGQASKYNDKDLAPNSQTKVACMLYAILREHNYDLSPPKGKGITNDLIVKASQLHGTPVTRNFVAPWLIRAHQLDIDLKK